MAQLKGEMKIVVSVKLKGRHALEYPEGLLRSALSNYLYSLHITECVISMSIKETAASRFREWLRAEWVELRKRVKK